MNKLLLGLLLGGVLGALDGLTALFSGGPEEKSGIIGIVIASTVKGIIAGILTGWFARKVNSLALGILFGLAVGAALAFIIAAMLAAQGKSHWVAIMVPGSMVGLIVGYATQRYGARAPQLSSN
jgi:hypothetical protein